MYLKALHMLQASSCISTNIISLRLQTDRQKWKPPKRSVSEHLSPASLSRHSNGSQILSSYALVRRDAIFHAGVKLRFGASMGVLWFVTAVESVTTEAELDPITGT